MKELMIAVVCLIVAAATAVYPPFFVLVIGWILLFT